MSKLDELEAMQVAMEFIEERTYQIGYKGYTNEHDDTCVNGELAAAAASYALWDWSRTTSMSMWPFGSIEYSSVDSTIDDRITRLTKAGALIIAEIQRLWRIKRKEYLDKFEDIPGYEGRYQANGYGIKSLTPWKKGGMLTIVYNKRFPVVNLIDKDGVRKQWYVEDLLKK